MPPNGDMDWEGTSTTTVTSTSRKRTLDEVTLLDDESTPRIACQPIEIVQVDEAVEPDKKSRALEECDNTQNLLQSAQQGFQAMPAPPIIDLEKDATATQETWHRITKGVTPLLTNETGDKFKCIACDMQSQSALGVATHYGRYCTHKGVKEEDPEAKLGEEEEDII